MEPDYKFSKAELADFKRFWEGDVGKKYTEKMERTKEQLLEAAMVATDRDGSACYVHIANGVDSIIKDIEALVKATEEEEDKKKTKKSSEVGLGNHHPGISRYQLKGQGSPHRQM